VWFRRKPMAEQLLSINYLANHILAQAMRTTTHFNACEVWYQGEEDMVWVRLFKHGAVRRTPYGIEWAYSYDDFASASGKVLEFSLAPLVRTFICDQLTELLCKIDPMTFDSNAMALALIGLVSTHLRSCSGEPHGSS
jgi:hypothetical protein